MHEKDMCTFQMFQAILQMVVNCPEDGNQPLGRADGHTRLDTPGTDRIEIAVDFFSQEEDMLGSKESLDLSLHEITRIPVKVHQEKASSNYSV